MTLRIATTVNDQYLYFTAPPGLGTWVVYRSRNNAAAAIMTTPTVAEVDGTNMPGSYTLLLDEDMTIGASNITEHMAFHISAGGWSGAIFTIELFDPTVTLGTDAITAATLATGAIEADAFAAGAITATVMATGAIDADALATSAVTEIAQGTWAEVLGTTSLSASALVQVIAGVVAGEVAGGGTTTITIRNVQDTATVVSATVDASGNRTAVSISTPST